MSCLRYLGCVLKRIICLLTLTLVALTPELAHAFPRIACCDSLDNSSSCWVTPTPADLTACDPAAIVALCELDVFGPTFCVPVTLQCCADSSMVVWLDVCKPHAPGMECSGTVTGEQVGQ